WMLLRSPRPALFPYTTLFRSIGDDSVQVGELVLDAGTYRITFRGQELKLGPTEFKLLHYLMKHAERVHTRGTLLDKIWGDHVYRSEEHTSELQSRENLVCRLL